MVLVMLGTQNNSFNRLLEEVEKCINNGTIKEEVIVQAGGTNYKSDKMLVLSLITNDELQKYIRRASYVICHGGVGSIISSIKEGKKVISVPRYEKYGEHVNDHQVQIVESFTEQGLIKGIKEVNELENAILEIDKFEPQKFVSNTQNVISMITDFIDNN
ncbi:MAG: exopolysaccharide biosynthesis protein [Clostridia bacterium]|nr:exopolysaccharide biosynthesis protein [Clostridia bacterium]MBO6243331.1 exopolysaccharide biosynthesis protein [Clostridia bacterium]